MNFEALDSTKLIVFMIAGAAFSGVGLYLLLRPRAEGAAKIELFGLKFESSSAGLLVFLVGAAFMSLPLFVKEEVVAISVISQPKKDPPSRVEPSAKPDEITPFDLSAASNTALIEEVEPNDAGAPNSFSLGQRVKGKVRIDEPDFFVMNVPKEGVLGHRIMLRHVDGAKVSLEVYNAQEEHIGSMQAENGAKYLDIKSDFPNRMHFKVHANVYNFDVRYELAVVPPN